MVQSLPSRLVAIRSSNSRLAASFLIRTISPVISSRAANIQTTVIQSVICWPDFGQINNLSTCSSPLGRLSVCEAQTHTSDAESRGHKRDRSAAETLTFSQNEVSPGSRWGLSQRMPINQSATVIQAPENIFLTLPDRSVSTRHEITVSECFSKFLSHETHKQWPALYSWEREERYNQGNTGGRGERKRGREMWMKERECIELYVCLILHRWWGQKLHNASFPPVRGQINNYKE